MKKTIILLILTVVLVSCYEDYIKDFDYDGVYFAYPIDVRTFVVGEGMQIKFGVSLGGVRNNNRDRIIDFQLDNNFISAETLEAMKGGENYIQESVADVSELKPLPSNYYTLSDNNKFVIKKGEHSGTVTMKVDSAKFLSDAFTLNATYALSVRLTSADADTILESNNYAVIGVKYENMLFGNYWHGGVTLIKDASGNLIDTILYPTTIPSPDSKAWKLKTIAPMTLVTNGVSDESSSSKSEFAITLKDDGNITINSIDGATYEVQSDGTSRFNQAKLLQNRKILLSYKYQNANGYWCHATDTLTFRNRIR
ncbi:DUF1735 domain-containing protein, partial [bacterium]|nr:DUF1735 domain-containing protein [bacterium]